MLSNITLWAYWTTAPLALLVSVLFGLKAWSMRREGHDMDPTWWLMVGVAVAWLGTGLNDAFFGTSRWLAFHGHDTTWVIRSLFPVLFKTAIIGGAVIHLYMISRATYVPRLATLALLACAALGFIVALT